MPEIKIPKKIEEGLKLRGEKEHIDEETAARELLYKGVEDYVLELYGKGMVSLSRAAEILGKSVYDVLRGSRKKGQKSKIAEREADQSRETTKDLF